MHSQNVSLVKKKHPRAQLGKQVDKTTLPQITGLFRTFSKIICKVSLHKWREVNLPSLPHFLPSEMPLAVTHAANLIVGFILLVEGEISANRLLDIERWRSILKRLKREKAELENGEKSVSGSPLCTLASQATDILRSTVGGDKSLACLQK